MLPWWGWAIGAALLGIAEMHVPGSYLIWIALGAALTAAATAVWELALTAQIGVFAAASAVSCAVGYFVYRALGPPRGETDALNERNRLLVGAAGVATEDFVSGRGKVRIGDTVWLAEGANLMQGTPIAVRSVRGTRVAVEAAAGSSAASAASR